MRLRRSFLAAVGLVALVLVVPRASAVVTEVGGGAQAILATGQVNGPTIGTIQPPTALPTGFQYGSPWVVLEAQGSPTPIVNQTVSLSVGSVSSQLARVSTVGTLQGTPYAKSSASLFGVFIGGRYFRAIESECTWDINGARASTTITNGNGQVVVPLPTSRMSIPGGYIAFNEQVSSTLADGSEVITVVGAHVFFNQPVATPLVAGGVITEVILAHSLCDPKLPPLLTGLSFLE